LFDLGRPQTFVGEGGNRYSPRSAHPAAGEPGKMPKGEAGKADDEVADRGHDAEQTVRVPALVGNT
jgi:hypothetical protein